MMSPALSQEAAALNLTGQIAANPALAPALLRLLGATGNDPARLGELTEAALNRIADALPVAPSAAVTIEAVAKEYLDARGPKFGPHDAIDFTVKQSSEVMLNRALIDLLGEKDAERLIADWGDRVEFTKNAPAESRVILFVNSNNKSRSRDSAPLGAETSQAEDFTAAGLEFADDAQATIVCATAVKKAKVAGLDLSKPSSSWANEQSQAVANLDKNDLNLLTKLRDGIIRSRAGALFVDAYGRLCANFYNDYSDPYRWAFGASPSAE